MAALAWQLEWGGREDFLADLAEERLEAGEAPPKALVDRPELSPGLRLYFDAFTDIDKDRPSGLGGIGAIPFTSIDAYARRIGIDAPDEFRMFMHLIQRMDAVLLDDFRRRHPPEK